MKSHYIASTLALFVLAISCRNGDSDPLQVESITVLPETLELTVGETFGLTVEYTPEEAENKEVTWSSSESGTVSVDGRGTVTAISPGTATVTARCAQAEAQCTVTVREAEAESIILNMTEATINIAGTVRLEATVLPETISGQTVTWSSSAPSVASVDQDGTVTGITEGKAVITASCGKAEAECKIEVIGIPVSSVSVTPAEKEMEVGDIFRITATVLPEDATDKTITWTSSEPSVASVDNKGIVTGKAEGSATITASAGGFHAECRITVTAAEETEEPVASIKQDWTVGELFDYPEYGKGIVFQTGEDFIKVVSFVEEGTHKTYSDLGATPVCTDTNLADGKQVTDKIEASGMLESYPAVSWARAKGEFWYLPTIIELHEIFSQSAIIDKALSDNGSARLPVQAWSCIESSSDTDRVYAYVLGSPRAYLRTQACEVLAVMKLRFK